MEQYPELGEHLIRFIERQHLFFVGTAARDGHVNVSPKGQDSLRVLDPKHILWLNLTGSGNETAAHVRNINRMTLMWCSFEAAPMILRVYGTAETMHPGHARWEEFGGLLPAPLGARQYFLLDVDLVQTSCGYGVPYFEFREDRNTLTNWTEKKGEDGIRQYWADMNRKSIDGYPTGIFDSE